MENKAIVKAVAFCHWVRIMYEGLNYCIRYYSCKVCPMNARCEAEEKERLKNAPKEEEPKREKIIIEYKPK